MISIKIISIYAGANYAKTIFIMQLKKNHCILVEINHFPLSNPFPADETLQASSWSITISLESVQTNYIP